MTIALPYGFAAHRTRSNIRPVVRDRDRSHYAHAVTAAMLDDIANANAYARMAHDPRAYAVQASYLAFAAETMRQWRDILSAGHVVFTFHAGDHDYPNSAAMADDIRAGHLWVRLSDNDGLPADHPMAARVDAYGVVVRPGEMQSVHLSLNDVFRAVHDVMGHYGAHGATHYSFGPNGERSAWLRHRTTYSPAALPALWCETRGQSAWVNDYADHRSLPLASRPFAEQKAGVPALGLA